MNSEHFQDTTQDSVNQIIMNLSQSILQDLTQHEIVKLSKKCKLISFNCNDILYTQGQEDLNPIILLTGLVKLASNVAQGRECILHIIRPNAFIDLGVLWYEAGAPYNAIAIDNGKGLLFDKMQFLEIVETNVNFANKVLKTLVPRQRLFMHKISSSHGRISVSCRVSGWLLHRSKMDLSDLLHLDINRELLARLLGVTRESLCRELSRLQSLGYIAVTRKTIQLLNKTALLKLATR